MEEKIFVVIVCKLLEQQNDWNLILKIALKLITNKLLRYLKKVNVLNSKIYDNGKQNLNESYTNKYQKRVACSYGYKLACVDDKFSKRFKSKKMRRCCLQIY